MTNDVRERAVDVLPRALVDPPWSREEEAPKEREPVVVAGLTPPAGRSIVWAPGERDAWSKIGPVRHARPGQDDEDREEVRLFLEGRMFYEPHVADLLSRGPEELVRPLLAAWRPTASWDFSHGIKPIVARFELEAWDVAFAAARRNASGTGTVLLPFLDVEVARLMADWLYRLTSAREVTAAWFGRHGVAVVPLLVPDALGRRRAARRNAEAALRHLAEEHGRDRIVEAARDHGDPAADAVAHLLADDPARPLPSDPKAPPKPPRLPTWADPETLPRPVLRGGGEPLPPEPTRTLLMMLAMADGAGRLPGLEEGLDEALAVCEPGSLAAFGWALFEAWESAGLPGRESWALKALGRLGDDDTARRLTPLIKVWPGQSGHARAALGADVLAAIGTDVALMHLNGIAQKVRYRALREHARGRIEAVAERRGLDPDRLADRLVPDFGLDADGGMTLDYGPRRFTVGFDEQLRPYVVDQDGRRRKDLPEPGVRDDAVLAPAARKRFADLRKDVRTVAADQIHRLETAMVTGRRWTPDEFGRFLLGHPLVRHIARRLVWLCETGEGVTAFRVAEDGGLADVEDDAFTPPDPARVGVAHPLHLGGTLQAWTEMFADYRILQPFPQLTRPVHTLTEQERAGDRLERFEGATVPVGGVLGLTRRGWERGAPQDGGVEGWISLRLPGGRFLMIGLNPGIAVGNIDLFPEQTLESVRLTSGPGAAGPSFGDLDPVTACELLTDLTALTASAV